MGVPILQMATIGILPSPFKKMYYRLRGAKIGKNVSLGLFSVIKADSIAIGDGTRIGPLTFIHCRELTLGKRVRINMMAAIDTGIVRIGDDSVVMEQVVVGGMLTPRSALIIGKRVKIFPYSFLNPTERITIEDEVGIGGANYLFTHGSWQPEMDGFPVAFGPITIRKGVWFPWRVFVMPNVTVGEYATIGAGSVLTKDVPERALAAGSPAKVLRQGNEYIKQVDEGAKHALMQGYMAAMAEFLDFTSHLSRQIEVTEDGCHFTCQFGRNEVVIGYSRLQDERFAHAASIFISLIPISESVKAALVDAGKTYFDVGDRETFFRDREEWYAVRDFLSRYGLRFNCLDE